MKIKKQRPIPIGRQTESKSDLISKKIVVLNKKVEFFEKLYDNSFTSV